MSRPAGELRSKILQEAIAIVYREGPARITIRSLAQKLGYSAATIYLHFDSKDELLKEIALHGFDALAQAIADGAKVDDPFEAVADTARRYIQFGLDHPELYRLMFQDIPLAGPFKPEELERVLVGWKQNRSLYERGIASGHFRPSDPELEANIGWAMLHGFVQLANSGRLQGRGAEAPDMITLRDAIVDARLRALRP